MYFNCDIMQFLIYLSHSVYHDCSLHPVPPLRYAVKDQADGSTNPCLIFLLKQLMAGMDNASKYHQHQSETCCEMSLVFIRATVNDMIAPWGLSVMKN